MDWFRIAQTDWGFYHDKNRIAQYVINEKITPEQYEQITGESYAV